jgi:hypothetical protein
MPVTAWIRARCLPIAACALLLAACSKRTPDPQTIAAADRGGAAASGAAQGIIGASVAALTENQLKERSMAALDGDAGAAVQVMMYYQMWMLDRRNAEYWAQIAAENGDWVAMAGYASYLMDFVDPERCRRAAYWIKRALAVAPEERIRLTESAQEIKEKCSQL